MPRNQGVPQMKSFIIVCSFALLSGGAFAQAPVKPPGIKPPVQSPAPTETPAEVPAPTQSADCMTYVQNESYMASSQATALCGDASIDCIRYIRNEYPYPGVMEAVKACAQGADMDCLKYVRTQYPYPNMNEAIKSCTEGVTADCIKEKRKQYPYPSVGQAAKLCKPAAPTETPSGPGPIIIGPGNIPGPGMFPGFPTGRSPSPRGRDRDRMILGPGGFPRY
jgi:hypothetical protein